MLWILSGLNVLPPALVSFLFFKRLHLERVKILNVYPSSGSIGLKKTQELPHVNTASTCHANSWEIVAFS